MDMPLAELALPVYSLCGNMAAPQLCHWHGRIAPTLNCFNPQLLVRTQGHGPQRALLRQLLLRSPPNTSNASRARQTWTTPRLRRRILPCQRPWPSCSLTRPPAQRCTVACRSPPIHDHELTTAVAASTVRGAILAVPAKSGMYEKLSPEP